MRFTVYHIPELFDTLLSGGRVLLAEYPGLFFPLGVLLAVHLCLERDLHERHRGRPGKEYSYMF